MNVESVSAYVALAAIEGALVALPAWISRFKRGDEKPGPPALIAPYAECPAES